MERPRAADDFEVIRERLEELRREREEISSTDKPSETPNADDSNADGATDRQDCRPGTAPASAPTIFLPQPTD
ncbi:MAG TPA: hypothetical protein VNV38_19655 [Stellaceae bacterium]|nr:hypothetical protein [Stellaceae bacterium]